MVTSVLHSHGSFTLPFKGTKPAAWHSRFDGFWVQARRAALLVLAGVACSSFAQDKPWHALGRDATPAERHLTELERAEIRQQLREQRSDRARARP